MGPLAKSVARVLGVSAGVLLGAASVSVLAVRQPSITNRARVVGSVASVDRLRADVAFLTRDAAPRDFRHPGNLELAARHIHGEFSKTGAVVVDQPYVARGGSFRNVIARLGPVGPGALIIGAHYDAFGDTNANPGADDNASGVAVCSRSHA